MPFITFASEAAVAAYTGMAEGISEVQADCDNHRRAMSTNRVCIAALNAPDTISGPTTVRIARRDLRSARNILANCLDFRESGHPGEFEKDERLHDGDVVISMRHPRASTSRKALSE